MTWKHFFVLLALAAWGAAAPALAEEVQPAPAPHRGEILRIPGLPPVELPPGAKVFGPRGPELGGERATPRPSLRGEKPAERHTPAARDNKKEAEKKPLLTPAQQRAQALEALFVQLAKAQDPDEAKAVSGAIERVWMHSGSDTADLLMERAVAALSTRKTDVALEILDHLVEIAPDWAEAWNQRATARFIADDIDGSMADLDETLRREPRHFGALSGLATILQQTGRDKRALEVMRRVLAINPQQPDLKKLIDRLAPEIEGRDI